ncbi:MAG: FadR family transcriptional regulator [Alphaproteobacteria bacterium]|nr:FadR family transcriptional regulator [Alphaproteobacteria bacterium]
MVSEIFSSIDQGRTADAVIDQIEMLILQGVLKVADRLPGERELANHLKVSRPIVREAIKTLEERGLLLSRHGGGTFVADVIGQIFSQPILDLIARHRSAAYDYLEYRREIEGVAASFAAQRATAADKALLGGIIDRMKSAHGESDFDHEAALDVEFHSTIGECAHNTILLHTLRSCYRLLSDGVFFNRALVYAQSGTREQLLNQHLAIYDAIIDGDADKAKQAAEYHMEYVAETMQQAERADDWERISELRRRQRS